MSEREHTNKALKNTGFKINQSGTMTRNNRARDFSKRTEARYQKMLGQSMRGAPLTPMDYKMIGKIVVARASKRWLQVDSLLDEWKSSITRRACQGRYKKRDLQNMVLRLDTEVDRGETKKDLCKKIRKGL